MEFFKSLIFGVNWWAICAVLLVIAMFVTVANGAVPDVLILPLGFTAVVCAIFSLEFVTTRALPRRNVKVSSPE